MERLEELENNMLRPLWLFPEQTQCILVWLVHKPNTSLNNYYSADVAGPVFQSCSKIFTDAPSTNEIKKTSIKEQNKKSSVIGLILQVK
jgi:hypothetical protein